MNQHQQTPALIRASELVSLVTYSLAHIRRLEEAGTFPRRIRIGANRVGWLRSEIEQWLKERIEGRST
jgi:prophage regulatory protein